MIWPSEQHRTASMSTAKTFPPSSADLLQAEEHAITLVGVAGLEGSNPPELVLLLSVVRAGQVDRVRDCVTVGIAERVHADDRYRAVVFPVLVEEGLVLDLASLIAGFHRTEHTPATGDRLELGEHRFLDEVGELVDDVASLERVLVQRESPLAVDDQLDRERSAHRLCGRRRHRFVVRVRVQRVGIVVDGTQRLQSRSDVVERHLLGVK